MRRAFLAAAAAALSACSGANAPTTPPPPAGQGAAILVGAGDIAECSSPGAEATARLLDRISGTVFTAGDNAYPSGSDAQFQDCYEPTWGRHKRRTRPTAGNHDYMQAGASGYYDYFGDSAGPRGLGYYTYTVGPWRIYAINSELTGGAMAVQTQWLRDELTQNPACSAAIWHKPLFTSGPNGENRHMLEIWRLLYNANVDVIINGHDHLYERFARQDPDGRPDGTRGIRQFTVGTGGVPLYSFGAIRPNSDVRASVWGVLVLFLGATSYEWSFLPAGIPGVNFRDTGSETCH